jgi:hypothetical protein
LGAWWARGVRIWREDSRHPKVPKTLRVHKHLIITLTNSSSTSRPWPSSYLPSRHILTSETPCKLILYNTQNFAYFRGGKKTTLSSCQCFNPFIGISFLSSFKSPLHLTFRYKLTLIPSIFGISIK